jgi:hypothetical protein
MAKYLIATAAFCLFAAGPLFSDIQPNYPNTNPNLTQENPTTNNNAYPQNNIFAPQVVPNVNVGDPGMVDDQDAIFRKNNQDE